MTETMDERNIRLALFARDAIKAKSDYRNDVDDVIARTARLKSERLEREAVIRMPAPKKVRARRVAPR
jgi:uncharacterized protein YeeX (DUF496 family)